MEFTPRFSIAVGAGQASGRADWVELDVES